MVHPDSRRRYSWWSDNRVSVKNSKWLHENLIDMDAKVRAMVRIIEEDADSFARRAEMYYQRRPELMNLVEEFYKAYCALAARYDHTTGELRLAHRIIADAFPDYIPFTLSDNSSWGSSLMDSEHNVPGNTDAEWSLFDLNNSQKDSLRVVTISPIVKKDGALSEDNDNSTGNRCLKQLNEMILSPTAFDKKIPQSGGGVGNLNLGSGRTRRGLVFEESEEDTDLKPNGPMSHERNELKLQNRETQYQVPYPQSEQHGVNVELENKNSQTAMDLEAERFSTTETQLYGLPMGIPKLQEQHEAAKIWNQQYKSSCQRVSDLEGEVSLAHEEIRSLNEDIFMSLVKFSSAQEHATLFEEKCESLQSDNESLEQQLIIQQKELKSAHNELEQIRNEIQVEHLQLMSCVATLALTTQQHAQLQEQHELLMLEHQNIMDIMGNMKQMNQALEDEVVRLKEENTNLNAQNVSFSSSIKDLHDVHCCLTEAKGKLEEEILIHISKGNTLQHEIDCMKHEKSNLEWRYNAMMEQILADMIEKEYLHSFVRHLQDEDSVLKENHMKKDEEQASTSQSPKTMEITLERSAKTQLDKRNEFPVAREKLDVLENAFHRITQHKPVLSKDTDDITTRIDIIVENMQIVEAMNSEIKDKHLCLEKEKEALLNQLEALQDENTLLKESCKQKDEEIMVMTQNLKTMESMVEKNLLLEKLLSEKNNDLEVVRDKLNILEHSFHSLMQEKSLLAQEKDDVAIMVDNMIQTVDVLEALHVEFKEKGFCLEKEKETLLNHLEEVQAENILLKEKCNKKDEQELAMSQVMQVMEGLSMENQLVGKLLSDKINDLEVVKKKLSNFEESISSLMMENSVLAKDHRSITAKVDELMQIEEISVALNTEVTENCINLEMEKKTLLKQIEDIQTCLEIERKQNISVVQSISDQLNNLEVRTSLLLLESEQLKSQLEEEVTCVLRAQIEVSVERCVVLDICRMCRDLSLECQEWHENSVHANEEVSQLKARNMEQQLQLESITGKHSLKVEEHIKLRYGMDQLLKLLKTDLDHVYPDKIGSEAIFHNLQSEVESMRALLVGTENDYMQIFMECLIRTTLLEQLGLEIYEVMVKKNALEMEAVALRQEIVMLQSGKQDLEKMNELLEQKNLAFQQRDQAWEMQTGIMSRQLYDLRESNRSLEHQNHKLKEESRSLAEDLLILNVQKNTLEEDNIVALLSAGNVVVMFNSYYTELEAEIRRLNADIGCINVDNYNLKEQGKVTNDKVKMLQMENLRFRELGEKLEEYEISKASLESEVDKFRIVCEELKDQTERGQKLLNKKEHSLSDARQKLEVMHDENAKISSQLECVKKESLEIKEMKEATEKANMDLTIVNTSMSKKMECMHREEEILKLELDGLKKKHNDLKLMEMNLKADLKENKSENEMFYFWIENLYCDLLASMIHSVVLEQHLYELKEQTQEHVNKFIGENFSMIAEIQRNRENALDEQETETKSEPIGHLYAIPSPTDIPVSPQDRCFALMSSPHSSLEDVLLNQCHYERDVDIESKDISGDKRDVRHDLHTLHAKINTMDMTFGSFEKTNGEYPEHKLLKEPLVQHQNILAEDVDLKCKTIKSILEEKGRLELGSNELLLKEIDQCLDNYLKTELKESTEEIESWKQSAETFYHDLQSCAVRETVMKEKWKELVGVCENLEKMSQHQVQKFHDNVASLNQEVNELKTKIMALEGLKEEVTCRSKASLSIVLFIKESMRAIQQHCLSTLRSQTSMIPKDDFHDRQDNPKMDTEFSFSGLETVFIELRGLQLKSKIVEALVEELSQFCRSLKNRDRTEKCYASFEHSRKNKIGFQPHKTKSRAAPLDSVRDSSLTYRSRAYPYKDNRTEDTEAEEQMLELWETAEKQCNNGAAIVTSVKASGSYIGSGHIFPMQKDDDKDQKVSKLLQEKVVIVDKMEVLSETRKNKVRDILSTEAHHLMELRNEAQGLNKRIEKLRSNSSSNIFEIDDAKEQLHRTGSAIIHLIEANHKLQSNSNDHIERKNNKLEEVKREKIDLLGVPHVPKTSKGLEKVAHLESDLQKVEFLLKRLEDDSIKKRHADIDRRAKDLLRGYLDGGGGRTDRKKQSRICDCIRPSTRNG